MIKKTGIRRFVTGLFLTLFVCTYCNATMFRHCHIIEGVTIIHSHFHPTSHQATPSGGHTPASLTLIASFNNIQCLDSGIYTYDNTEQPTLCEIIVETPLPKIHNIDAPDFYLRAPPASLL